MTISVFLRIFSKITVSEKQYSVQEEISRLGIKLFSVFFGLAPSMILCATQ